MKSSKRQREKDLDKTKTKPPHSISASGSSKILDVSKKSQVIQKKSDKPAVIQSKLASIKNQDGKSSLVVSKMSTPSTSTSNKSNDTRTVKTVVTNLKPNAQVESKVSMTILNLS